jgi:hypothetical protein
MLITHLQIKHKGSVARISEAARASRPYDEYFTRARIKFCIFSAMVATLPSGVEALHRKR